MAHGYRANKEAIMAENVQVGILMGSASDLPAMTAAGDVLDELNIGYEMRIMSAHRTPAEACLLYTSPSPRD